MADMSKEGERKVKTNEHAHGGAGFILMEPLVPDEDLLGKSRLFDKITIPPMCELGHHEHEGEEETYYILSGTGMYEEDGVAYPVEPGDVFTCKDGHGHGIKNTGGEDLVFVALILLK